MNPIRRDAWWPLVAAAISVGGLAAVSHYRALLWDDFLFLRVHPWRELRAVWTGPWAPDGDEPLFYRPLAIWAYAAGFMLAGLHQSRLLAIAAIELIAGAWLFGLFIRRETGTASLGAFAAAAYALHPAIAASAGFIWFEQNHRWSTILVAAALLAWQRVRSSERWITWWPVHLWIWLGSLFKEDVLMTLPLIAWLHWWRGRQIGDTAPWRVRTFSPWVAVWLAWMALRSWWLGALAGPPQEGFPTELGRVIGNLGRAALVVLADHRGITSISGTGHIVSTVVTLAVLLFLVVRLPKAGTMVRYLTGVGIGMFALYGVLLGLASSESRFHLITAAAVVLLTAAVQLAGLGEPPRRAGRIIACVTLAALALGATASYRQLAPCSPTSRVLDASSRIFLENAPGAPRWGSQWLAVKRTLCLAGRDPIVREALPALAADVEAGRRR